MKIFLTLARRELASYFVSITGYVVVAAVTLLIGLTFVMLIASLGSDTFPMPVTELFFNSSLFWIVLMLVAPVITMRLFALEKSTGTFETLMTTPVGDIQVVAAKFAAALIFYCIMWLPAMACLFIVGRYTNQAGALDLGTAGGLYLGIVLAGSMFLALGSFASAISRSQMVAVMISLAPNVCLFIVAYIAQNVPAAGNWKTQALSYFTLFQQMQDFSRGVVDTRVAIFYLCITFLFLFLTLRAVESRRWR